MHINYIMGSNFIIPRPAGLDRIRHRLTAVVSVGISAVVLPACFEGR